MRNLFFAWGPWCIGTASFDLASIVLEEDPVDLSRSVARSITAVAGDRQWIGSLYVYPVSILCSIAAFIVELFLGVEDEPRRRNGELDVQWAENQVGVWRVCGLVSVILFLLEQSC